MRGNVCCLLVVLLLYFGSVCLQFSKEPFVRTHRMKSPGRKPYLLSSFISFFEESCNHSAGSILLVEDMAELFSKLVNILLEGICLNGYIIPIIFQSMD